MILKSGGKILMGLEITSISGTTKDMATYWHLNFVVKRLDDGFTVGEHLIDLEKTWRAEQWADKFYLKGTYHPTNNMDYLQCPVETTSHDPTYSKSGYLYWHFSYIAFREDESNIPPGQIASLKNSLLEHLSNGGLETTSEDCHAAPNAAADECDVCQA
jgi:hypothetical protein